VFNYPSPIKLFSGNAQRVYDLAGDLHGSVNQWNLLISSGSMTITNISRLKIIEWDDDQENAKTPDQLQSLCDLLSSIMSELEAVVTGMGKIQDQYIALARLEDFQRKGTDVPTILFNSIPTPEFSRIVEEIKNAYTEELKIKRCIAENVAHCSTREEINFYGVGWSYQTSITAIIKRKFESLLIETDQC